MSCYESKGYFFWYGNSPNTVSLWRMDNASSWTQLKQSGALTVKPSSDVWKIQAVGSTISGYQNGNLVVQATDTTITSGSPGIWLYYAANQISNWSGGDVTAPATYSIGGTVSGLSGTVVLQDNGGNDLSVGANGAFTFSTGLATGAAYSVTVKTSPAGQTCSVANGSGTVGSANITNVAVTCSAAPTYSIGGTVSGLSGTVVLQDNGGNDLSVGANGAFTFSTGLATGAAYSVTVKTSPAGQTCSVANGSGAAYSVTVKTSPAGQTCSVANGSGTVGSANITNVAVTCSAAPTYSIGGTVSGLSGTVVLQDNGGNDLSVGANGAFTFSTGLATGAAYSVTVKTSPAGQTCSVANGSGTVSSANITNVAVTCSAAPTYSIGGTVSGLSGTVVLQDNGGNDLSVGANGAFTFSTGLATGAAYSVTVKTSPAGQTCSVANGSGTVGSANITNVAVTCTTNSASSGSDNFNRADGPLGSGWTDMSDGGLAISSQAAAGTSATDTSGDIRTAESYSSNQYSQVEVTSTQLTGSQWIGPAVRAQNGGQDGYAGIYNWNNGSPELMLFKRSSGTNWQQLGDAYASGPLAAGTKLKLMVVGSTLAFLENGVERIAAYDNSWTGGAPGIVASGTGQVDNWSAGSAGFEAHYLGTDAQGVESYDMISASNGYGPQILRVLRPTNPAAGVAHNFLYALPVEAGLGTSYGDGISTLETADAQNQYNLTIIEPSFGIESWYADNPNDANLQYETFMASELQPWVKANLATTGTEQNWLIGFSKSGIGAQDLLLKHPDLFTLAASWDFPADASSYDQFGGSSASSYGTDANFQANYRLSAAFLAAHKAPFTGSSRIWIGGYNAFQTDITDYDALLTSEGIAHTTETPTPMVHRWDSGWVPLAVAALEKMSLNVH